MNRGSNEIAAAFEYGPFGENVRAELLDATLQAAGQPFRYSTKYTDAETGLIYFGYRYYDPSLGRFINRDPIGEAGGVNLYGFVGNGPVNASDYLGLTPPGGTAADAQGRGEEIVVPDIYWLPRPKDSAEDDNYGGMFTIGGERQYPGGTNAPAATPGSKATAADGRVNLEKVGDVPVPNSTADIPHPVINGVADGLIDASRGINFVHPQNWKGIVDGLLVFGDLVSNPNEFHPDTIRAVNGVVDTVTNGSTYDRTRLATAILAPIVTARFSVAIEGGNLLAEARALKALGVDAAGRRAFFQNGEVVAFQFTTKGGDPVYGFVQYKDGVLTSQLFSIKNPNGPAATKALIQFRNQSLAVARTLGAEGLELQGGSVINKAVADFLARNGFEVKTVPVPEALGGGTQEVMYKVIPVKK